MKSLLFLLRLRSFAAIRGIMRQVRSLKGALLALVGSCIFIPMIMSAFLMPHVATAAQLDLIRKFGPLGLFVFCILNVVLSSDDRAIYYTPAEIDFLFSGPYRSRQILQYKIVAGAGKAALTAFFMTFMFSMHAASMIAAFVGLYVTVLLIYLLTLALGLAISTLGAYAFSMIRKFVLLGCVLAIAGALVPLGQTALETPWRDLLNKATDAPVMRWIVLPFTPFISTFTAERIWPDLVVSAAESFAILGGLVAAVVGLNARFLEASASSSAKLYARVQRARRGQVWSSPTKARFDVPMTPWLGGIGPCLWRQLTSAVRSPARLLTLSLLFLAPLGMNYLFDPGRSRGPEFFHSALGILIFSTLFGPTLVNFDFRSDLNRMEVLKTLPIHSNALALGQLLTSTLVLSLNEWLVLLIVLFVSSQNLTMLIGIAALCVPVNLLLVSIENMYFLWFPFQPAGVNSFDMQALGRQLLLMIARVATMGLAAGLSGGIGAVVYYLSGGNLPATFAVTWVLASACALAFIPIVGSAFVHFDVAGDIPE